MAPSPHPPAERLIEFGRGQVSVADSDAIERHLESCDTCRARVETAADDDFVKLVRDVLPSGDARVATRTAYRHVRFHAKGGLGEVSVARDEALGRDVAVKRLLPRGAASESVRARFLREARVTGRLEHPGIVPVYGVGEDDAGRPCYAMRFVPGETLADAIRALHANGPVPAAALRPLLARFVSLCGTVAYAHSKGVVHRDIKPNNVAIGPFGETILLDWGLAQVPDEPEPDHVAPEDTPADASARTHTGTILGTPGFLAPEQAAGGRVGPAADVFSLGVSLGCLLTGQWPHEPPGPTGAPIPLLSVAGLATARDPNARYATALDLAADLERWLADEAVTAYREPLPARVRRFVRHHATATAAAVSLLAVSVVGLVIGTVLVDRERGRTANALSDKTKLAHAEAEQRAKAEEKEKETAAVLGFTDRRIFAAGRPKGRDGGLGRDVKLAEALTAAEPHIATSFADQPLTEARVRTTLGQSFQTLGDAKAAERQLARARHLSETHRGPEHPDTLTARSNYAACLRALGRPDAALSLDEETLALRRKVLGPDHADTLRSMNNLANVYADLRRDEDALKLDEETYERRRATLGPEHPDTLWSMNGLGSSYAGVGRHDDALRIREAALPLLRKILGPDDPVTLIGMNNLAVTYGDLGRHREALAVRRDVAERMAAVNGPNHPDTLTAESNLARGHWKLNDLDEALRRHRDVLARRRVALAKDHSDIFVSEFNVIDMLVALGRGEEALPLVDDFVRRAAGKPIDPQFVPAVLDKRLRHFASRKDVPNCRATAATAEALNRKDPDSLYVVAALWAVTAGLSQDAADSDRAMAALHKTRDAGFKDVTKLKADDDFKFLRERADFRTLFPNP